MRNLGLIMEKARRTRRRRSDTLKVNIPKEALYQIAGDRILELESEVRSLRSKLARLEALERQAKKIREMHKLCSEMVEKLILIEDGEE